ncbi:MAG TPA: asparagine synthase (glutamine-hydrolyzing) [Longimicrobiales bacterium]|nr:asparagine synthase (glutamine-hydrolyzing) [Longimicrobiales bacterium]
MCGLIGAWYRHSVPTLDENLSAALHQLCHRGPDDRGHQVRRCEEGTFVLGHTRLSIIDLTDGGHQPMRSADGAVSIVFNGEIYNYKELRHDLKRLGTCFSSESDTEVLLQAWLHWGAACLPRLKGMFAFVVYDSAAGALTCVRDPFGIKPLFVSHSPDHFACASEIGAIRKLIPEPAPLDLQRAYDYLVNGSYDDEEQTFFGNIRHLLPGHILTFRPSSGRIHTERWWWPNVQETSTLTFPQAVEAVRAMFLDNVRLHLRSDVPLGAALSGGIDSSAIVCAMRRIEPDAPINTFSYIARGSRVDEESWVDLINRHVSAVSHKVIVSPTELAADLDDMIRAQGEPFGSTSIYAQYRVFRLAREQGITVTLDGQGADELLAGYHGFPGQRLLSYLDQRQPVKAASFAIAWAQWPGRTLGHAALALGDQLVPDVLRGSARRLTGRDPTPPWLDTGMLEEAGVRCVPSLRSPEAVVPGRRVSAALRRALMQRGLPALLRHGDRNSMRWSIESRVPFLSTDMAELVLGLPEEYLISPRGETKHVFRTAMRGLVPDAVLDRRDKIGFATPERDWLGSLGPQLDNWLDAASSVPFLRAQEARREVRRILDGQRAFSFRAWRLINYCRWLQVMET